MRDAREGPPALVRVLGLAHALPRPCEARVEVNFEGLALLSQLGRLGRVLLAPRGVLGRARKQLSACRG